MTIKIKKIYSGALAGGLEVTAHGKDPKRFDPRSNGLMPSAEVLHDIFDLMQVDGVATIEAPKPAPKIEMTGLQSADFVKGLRGWRLDKAAGTFEAYHGASGRISVDLETGKASSQIGELTYKINIETSIDGKPYAAGFEKKDDVFKRGNATEILAYIAENLADQLKSQILVDAAQFAVGDLQIGEAIGAPIVNNYSAPVAIHNHDGVTVEEINAIVRNSLESAVKPGGLLYNR